MYADLIALRLNRHGMTAGLIGQNVDVYHLNGDAKLIAFRRWKEGGPGDDVVVVMHFAESELSNYRLGFPSAGLWKLRFNSDSQLYNEMLDQRPAFDVQVEAEGADGQSHSALINIAAYSCLIYSQDK